MMIKTLYKEKCLRYFIIPEIILLFIFFFKFSILAVYIILPLYVFESIVDNIFFNIPLIWLLFKITTMYFCSIKFEKINKIEDEEKKKKYKIRLKIIIFLVNIVILVIFAILSTNLINQIVNTILSF
ncbi:hypothetical protein [Leptotrichia wadei]|uniref:Uncharacterized protein n=1 Tax=Leptotrichia wadei TaxID=157687 RepID=A0A510KD27_9FUSO|nr:hypothetical protein [Leptotrichia wadei]BBM49580.1 hypothetical protein JMUB3934_0875 [Leptotrichia wadei]